MRLQTNKPCRRGGKHVLKIAQISYNIDTLECAKCGDTMPKYTSLETTKKRLGEKMYACSNGHAGKCAENLEPMIQRSKPIWVVKCCECGQKIDESKFT